MAFQREDQSKRYECLSTDVKLTEGIAAGSTCTEFDTGKEFIFSGTTWGPKLVQALINGSLANIPVEQKGSNVDVISELLVLTPIAAGAFLMSSKVDISQYVAVSSIVEFDVAPGAVLKQQSQEVALVSGGGSCFLDVSLTSDAVINVNTVIQKRKPLQMGDQVRVVINNTDAVGHNVKWYKLRGWRR